MNIKTLLDTNRTAIIDEWLRKLQTEVSPSYSSRPEKELILTVTRAMDADYDALVHGNFDKLNQAIDFIGNLRGKAGFTLSEVQKAFELFRTILVPILEKEMTKSEAFKILDRLNHCLAYTIHKFSDQFQQVHEREIKQHAKKLEVTVEERTRELAESERKYRQLVEEIRDGYFIHKQGIIVFANQAFCDMHGYTLDQVIGSNFRVFVAPESLADVERLYEDRTSCNKTESQYAYLRLNSRGEAFPTENKVIVTQYEGEPVVMGICRDITERTEIEKRVREAERFAHIGQLTTSIAHEIRNPLSAAGMSVQDLLKHASLSGNNERRLEIIGKELARVNKIVTEMLDFAKPVKFEFHPESVELLIKSCLDVLEARIREQRVRVVQRMLEPLPELLMDREKMLQALINILLNSLEAIGENGRLEISASMADGNVRIGICDNGPGIAEEDLAYAFDPFFSRKKKGTGLGLANAKKIVEAHGGLIDIRGMPKGTEVTVTLPCPDTVGSERRT
ncbi:PAS domain S-box protein [Desulfomonile tiedjei]|uniref:histidine kinase n=1 Tax=Desulfomonile tiedjei (strain ATCC 49306 / DSM 6799 / DCB-1) TaxID=706587 RepID=I4CEB9_DESTA|nr:PAS domain S-box protein [Desulfomonile tiedjei]AFM27910.1 PAS domain S-box [Desulfomonile tiedjei DSM 6799]